MNRVPLQPEIIDWIRMKVEEVWDNAGGNGYLCAVPHTLALLPRRAVGWRVREDLSTEGHTLVIEARTYFDEYDQTVVVTVSIYDMPGTCPEMKFESMKGDV